MIRLAGRNEGLPTLPALTVAAVVCRDGRYLCVEERVRGRRVLNQPAGHLEPGETLEQAVIRETREETGLAFRPGALCGVYHWAPLDGPSFLRFAFVGDCEEMPQAVPLDPAILAVHWLEHAALREQEAALRSPLVLACVNDHRAGRNFPLSLLRDLVAAPPAG